MQYYITKYKGKIMLFDSLATAYREYEHNVYLHQDKNQRLYYVYELKELEDYYCDIGPIYSYKKCRDYVGKVIFETNDLYELFEKYQELKNKTTCKTCKKCNK